MKINNSRSCKSQQLKIVFNLGNQSLTGVFPKSKNETITKRNLSMVICGNCSPHQLQDSFNPDEMYVENYGYMSSLN